MKHFSLARYSFFIVNSFFLLLLSNNSLNASAAKAVVKPLQSNSGIDKDAAEITISLRAGGVSVTHVKISKDGTVRDLRNAYAKKIESDNPSSFVLYYLGLRPFETRGSGIGRSIGDIDLDKDALLVDVLKIDGIEIAVKKNPDA